MGLRNKKKRIGDMLIDEHMITEEQLQQALVAAKESQKKIGEVLVELGFVTEEGIANALSRQLGIDVVTLSGVKIEEDLLKLVNGALLRKHTMIPFEYARDNLNVVRVAMADPMDMTAIDDFAIVSNMQVEPVIATTREIMMTLDKYYGDSEAMMAAERYAKERELVERAQQNEENNEEIDNSPIVQLVRSIIEQAARQRASDIHIEALEKTVRVRYRIDGVLYERFTYDIQLLPAIIARIKILGGMLIAEKRKPQDGRITMMVDRREYDIRVSVLPTVFGEKCVMRLAQKNVLTRDKSELGLSPQDLQQFDEILKNPHGMIVVTGPTGSGKSTTLYTVLSELNRQEVNIITVEDPVEANVDGINQVQVNTKADLTFATALRSILRQDPDIIMIGEIRDSETAEIAVQASITGHLVVSTLHTNSAAGSLTRLMDMGVESYLLADSIVGVIAQRLVRRLCPACKKQVLANAEEKALLGVAESESVYLHKPCGCAQCGNTGYAGRIGIYEIMKITPEIREAIALHKNSQEIQRVAAEQGMHTLQESARNLVFDGVTTVAEMMGATYENE